MEYIRVTYPNGTYTLWVDDATKHIYDRVMCVDGYMAANHLARLWVGARRTKRAKERPVEQNQQVSSRKEEFCWNRACYSCGNYSCTQRVCPEK
jgi:hypothetical protein